MLDERNEIQEQDLQEEVQPAAEEVTSEAVDTQEKKPRKGLSPTVRTVLITVFACVFLFSGYLLLDYYLESRREAQGYENLSQMVGDVPTRPLPTIGEDDPNYDPYVPQVHYVTVLNSKTGEYQSVLPQYADLFSLNPDFAGWLQIPGTTIDYPVMHTPEDPDHYLNLNFYGSETRQGSIFADGRCDLVRPSENIILHGHHMRDGSMFGSLMDYESEEFYKEHKYIFFDTLTETHTYEVVAVFISSVNAGADFPYYQFVESDDAGYDSFIRLCKRYALYDTGVDAVYGENLLTLSTCEYTADNNRFVVVAKCID